MNIPPIIQPKRLNPGSHIRVVAPVRSLKLISQENIDFAIARLQEKGFIISFGKHVKEMDQFNSSSVESRIDDLHDAFRDPEVDGILTVIGGYNSNQLLNYIDYELIKKNPKVICGFSDVTAFANAITAKTGMITYIGPHFSSWSMKHGFEYADEHFLKACANNQSFDLLPSSTWSDDLWFLDQEKRDFIENEGYWVLNEGIAEGRLVGGHARCFTILQGTTYWPGLQNSIIIIEDDEEINPSHFDRQLQTLIHQKDFDGVKGIIIGRFQKKTMMTKEILQTIIDTKTELKNIPIIANVNLGHTTPIATFPIGGTVSMNANLQNPTITFIKH